MIKIDREYVRRIIGEIMEGLDEVKDIIMVRIEDFVRDRGKRFSMRYSIILIVEAAADLGLAILKQCFNEGAESYREVFIKLAEKGVISYDTAEGMASLASLRNMVVHRYWSIDDVRIYREARNNGVRTVEKFIKEVKNYVYKNS
ncbi:MAG: DUF86 domain-containing protein [Thermoprotei archaeon]|nr:DUF86 domain-containing protein [Thermoprotei archaeon]